jgi:chitinase
MSCATAGATIYYTTDGTDPTTSSAIYPSSSGKKKFKGIKISGKGQHTVKAMAAESGYNNSDIAVANFTID